ncbi:MAG TPA: D-aminoacyl-tRNA deacylase [Miltoncostaeaceae bacterium]|nr:D-aminoacyl-tRNA deacylase [Miltoncostaeaceae bacterium]
MRVVLQRVDGARVEVDGEVVGQIGDGLLALVGVARGDGPEEAARLARKTLALRLFPVGDRPFEVSVADAGGGVLVVSQFTLLGDARRGNRPSWAAAAPPAEAAPLVDAYAAALAAGGVPVARGRFGAHMRVGLVNDGPVTLVLDAGGGPATGAG